MIPSILVCTLLAPLNEGPEPILLRVADPLSEAPVVSADEPADQSEDDLWSRLSLYANGRLRGESTFDQTNGVDRHRGRFRFRFGGEFAIDEHLRAGARLTTLSDGRDANNPHWDFGDGEDGFAASEVGLDRLYLEWDALSTLELTGGKFAHNFTRPPVTGEFAWDGDVQPAGAAATWSPARADSALKYDLRAISVVATEINAAAGSSSDPAMHGAQANLSFAPCDAANLHLASSYSKWTNLSSFAEVGSSGNTADAGGFEIWDSYAALTWQREESLPLTVYGQYVNNLDDDSGEDSGFVAGLRYGATGGKGRANVFAATYSLDANAIFAPVAQDDTPIAGSGAGTGMDGFVVGGQYFIDDNLSLKVWVLTSDVDGDDDPYRIRIDLNFSIL